jgi:acyl-coenzyme A thioesterase PaaI-like protein
MGRTLHTAATVPHTAHLRRRATGDDARAETVLLVALGRGLNSHADILHGGIQAVLLDEVTGLFVLEALGLAKGAGSGIFTGGASLRFRAPVRTPGVYLLRACAVDEGWGRGGRWEVKAVLEDGAGRVLTEGWSVYVRAKGKL